MKAVVTGAKGMLGQDLCPVFEDAGIFVNSFGSKELDVTNYDETRQIIGEISPQIIVNLAAIQMLTRQKKIMIMPLG